MKKAIFILITIITSGCSTIQHYNKLEQPEDKTLTASVGSTIFRLNKSGDLPNVFGKADLYGGKIDRGFTELKFKGIQNNGNIILQINDTNKTSTETTVDRYLNKNKNVSATNNINLGEDKHPDITTFEFNPKLEKELTISGITITFMEITTYSIRYKLKNEL